MRKRAEMFILGKGKNRKRMCANAYLDWMTFYRCMEVPGAQANYSTVPKQGLLSRSS